MMTMMTMNVMQCNVSRLHTENQRAPKNSFKRVRAFQIEFESRNVGFWAEGKTGVPGEKPLGAEKKVKKQSPVQNPTRATPVGGKHSHYCDIPASHHHDDVIVIIQTIVVLDHLKMSLLHIHSYLWNCTSHFYFSTSLETSVYAKKRQVTSAILHGMSRESCHRKYRAALHHL